MADSGIAWLLKNDPDAKKLSRSEYTKRHGVSGIHDRRWNQRPEVQLESASGEIGGASFHCRSCMAKSAAAGRTTL